MAMGELPNKTIRPVSNASLRRICNLAGLSQAKTQLNDLQSVKRSIEITLKDLDQAADAENSDNSVAALLRFVGATCDAFIGMAAALSSATGATISQIPGLPKSGASDQARVIKGLYSTAMTVVDGSVRQRLGEKVDWTATGLEALKKSTDIVFSNNKDVAKTLETARYVAKNTVGKAEIGLAAIKNDQKKVISKSKDYARDLAKYTLDQLKEQAPNGVKATKAYIDISKEVFAYNDKLVQIADNFVMAREETDERRRASKATLKRLGQSIQKKIDEIDALLRSCDGAPEAAVAVPGPR